MIRSIGKQSGEFVESFLKNKNKKKKATVGMIGRKGRLWAWNEISSEGVMDNESGESMELMEEFFRELPWLIYCYI